MLCKFIVQGANENPKPASYVIKPYSIQNLNNGSYLINVATTGSYYAHTVQGEQSTDSHENWMELDDAEASKVLNTLIKESSTLCAKAIDLVMNHVASDVQDFQMKSVI